MRNIWQVMGVSVAVVMLIATAGQSQAAIHAGVYVQVHSTGTDASGNNAVPAISISLSGESAASATAGLTSYVDNESGSRMTYTGRGSAFANDGNIGVYAGGTTGGGESGNHCYASGEAAASWSDHVSLLWQGTGDPPAELPSTYLVFCCEIEGALSVSINGADPLFWTFSEAYMAAYCNDQFMGVNLSTVGAGASERGAFPSLTSTVAISQGGASFFYSLRTYAKTHYGSAKGAFLHTMKLDSITFSNGRTPESYGYDLVFESGMQSPNLNSVPEPTSFALWSSLSVMGLIGARRRRRRGARSPCMPRQSTK